MSALIYNQISSCRWKICKMYNKFLNHVENQSTMTEMINNTTKWACAWQSIGKSTNCKAVDWSTTTHVEKSRDLKSADINRLVQLRRESYDSIARDWNFHGKYPISSLPSTSIKSKWRREAPSCLYDYAERFIVTFLFRNRLTWNFSELQLIDCHLIICTKNTNFPSSAYVKKCVCGLRWSSEHLHIRQTFKMGETVSFLRPEIVWLD